MKVSKKTKKQKNKLNQSELLDKRVENAIMGPHFINISQQPSSVKPKKKQVKVKIISRKKPKIRLYLDEWSE